jgi:putative transcriptional regulator
MAETLKGQLLIAGRALRDPNFFRSVVLIAEHGSGGALGLIINRPTSVNLAKALAEHFQISDNGAKLYVGGPVEPQALFILHDAQQLAGGAEAIVPGVYVGNSAEVFERVVRAAHAGDATVTYRVLCGCAGWAPGQLEAELARTDWLLWPAEKRWVFSDCPHDLWETLLKQAARAHSVVPDLPGDPMCN